MASTLCNVEKICDTTKETDADIAHLRIKLDKVIKKDVKLLETFPPKCRTSLRRSKVLLTQSLMP